MSRGHFTDEAEGQGGQRLDQSTQLGMAEWDLNPGISPYTNHVSSPDPTSHPHLASFGFKCPWYGRENQSPGVCRWQQLRRGIGLSSAIDSLWDLGQAAAPLGSSVNRSTNTGAGIARSYQMVMKKIMTCPEISTGGVSDRECT